MHLMGLRTGMGRTAWLLIVAGSFFACASDDASGKGGPSPSGGMGGGSHAGGTGEAGEGGKGGDASSEEVSLDAQPADAGWDGMFDAAPDAGCQTAADCSDGLACNGVEACGANLCTPGAAPCSNPNAAHCAVTCTETGMAVPKCTVAPLDADGDGHGDEQCPAGGDDCDDANAAIHPGAAELCDGLDGNCNGQSDIADLGFKSSAKEFAAGTRPSTAYATPLGKFGVAWGYPVRFALMGLDGLTASAPITVGPSSADGAMPNVAWGGDSFAVVWAESDAGNSEIYFVRVSATGVAMGPSVRLTFDPAASVGARIVRSGQDWIVVWYDTRDGVGHLFAKRLAADGTPKSSDQRVIVGGVHEELGARVAMAGSSVGLVWMARTFAESETWIWTGALDPTTLTVGAPHLLDHASKPSRVVVPAMAGDANGFAVAWARDSYASAGGDLVFARLKADASFACGPTIAYSETSRAPWPHAVAFTPTGAAIAGISTKSLSYNDLFLLRMTGTACAVAGPANTLASENVALVDLASGPLGTALVSDHSTSLKVYSRVFGPKWCD